MAQRCFEVSQDGPLAGQTLLEDFPEGHGESLRCFIFIYGISIYRYLGSPYLRVPVPFLVNYGTEIFSFWL